ncbi:MAG: hypothetical protein P1U32_07305 [Legionellaceae bacterium]|nr:hypothetical protein [Legionellaceae bacterium]
MTKQLLFTQKFNWNTLYRQLSADITQARSTAFRPHTMTLIEHINKNLAHQLNLQQTQQMTPGAALQASDTCAHAAWIFVLEQDKDNATKFLDAALTFGVTGLVKYIECPAKRADRDFEGALASSESAIALFNAADESDTVLAHAHIQVGLTAMRLGRIEMAETHFSTAERLAAAPPSAEQIRSYAEHIMISSEGNPKARLYINWAQLHNKLKQYDAALACLNLIPPLSSPIDIAYNNNVYAETYIGLGRYNDAKVRLDETYAFYKTENLLETDNAFRNMLGSLEVNLALDEPLTHLDAINALYRKRAYKPSHDFRVRLDNIFGQLNQKAQTLITEQYYQEALPLLDTVYHYYLNALEVNLAAGEPLEYLEQAQALQGILFINNPEHPDTTRLQCIVKSLEDITKREVESIHVIS